MRSPPAGPRWTPGPREARSAHPRTAAPGRTTSPTIRSILRRDPHVHVINLDLLTYAGNLESLADVEAKYGAQDVGRYTFVHGDIADAVIAARRRGAQVQILLNDHQVTRAQRKMKRAIGRNPARKNFVYECDSSCRGRRDNLHTKFYLFSSPGAATETIPQGVLPAVSRSEARSQAWPRPGPSVDRVDIC